MFVSLDTLYACFRQSTCVTTDSRHCPQGSLFVALRGANFDGNAYAAKALEAGSRWALIDNEAYLPAGDARYLLTDNCLLTLQLLARMHRRRMKARVIGITGTNGKTTTKELLSAVLKTRYRVLHTEGNLNNQIGVPLTLLRMTEADEVAVVEMGASHPGDIRELVGIAEPDCGLITNVGKAHLLGFGSVEGVARTKGELYDFLRTRAGSMVFVDSGQERLLRMSEGLNRVCYGCRADDFVCGRILDGGPCLSFEWTCSATDGRPHVVTTQLIGSYNLSNALAAVAVGNWLKVDAEELSAAIARYEPSNGRSQLKRTARNTLVVDAYNANPTSMRASIDNFLRLQAGEKMLILGDMRELGADSRAEHQAIVDYLSACGLTHVVLVGTEFAATRHTFAHFDDVAALSQALSANPPCGKTILIKGSNGVRLQSIVDKL